MSRLTYEILPGPRSFPYEVYPYRSSPYESTMEQVISPLQVFSFGVHLSRSSPYGIHHSLPGGFHSVHSACLWLPSLLGTAWPPSPVLKMQRRVSHCLDCHAAWLLHCARYWGCRGPHCPDCQTTTHGQDNTKAKTEK